MRKAIGVLAILAVAFGADYSCRAVENTSEYSVQASVSVADSPPHIALTWPSDGCDTSTTYTIYRKNPQDLSWGGATKLPPYATSYVDTNVNVGVPYEYQIAKNTPSFTGYGYVYAGIQVPMVEDRGTLLLVVDKTYAADLR